MESPARVNIHQTVLYYPSDGGAVQYAVVTASRDEVVESVVVSPDPGHPLLTEHPRSVVVRQVVSLHVPSTNEDHHDVMPGSSAGHWEPMR